MKESKKERKKEKERVRKKEKKKRIKKTRKTFTWVFTLRAVINFLSFTSSATRPHLVFSQSVFH
jgi:hypothetical protein